MKRFIVCHFHKVYYRFLFLTFGNRGNGTMLRCMSFYCCMAIVVKEDGKGGGRGDNLVFFILFRIVIAGTSKSPCIGSLVTV